jgi:geranylgeranyl diphosphate synthase type II
MSAAVAANADQAAWLESRRALVEQALDAALPPAAAWPPPIHEAMRYSVFAGGKRLRPLLVLAGCEAVGGRDSDALPLAAAVELIHTYSLIHDDLPAMDDDDLRRGKPTNHKVFGEANAILAGDALLTRAFGLLSELPPMATAELAARRLRAIGVLGEASGTAGLIGGQVADLAAEGHDLRPPELERIHRGKTGALLTACVVGGGLLGGGNAATLDALSRFGRAAGLGFQVIDDVLDATEGAQTLGKTPGKDARAGKATYVKLLGVDGARQRAELLLGEALGSLADFDARADALRGLARQLVERRS